MRIPKLWRRFDVGNTVAILPSGPVSDGFAGLYTVTHAHMVVVVGDPVPRVLKVYMEWKHVA